MIEIEQSESQDIPRLYSLITAMGHHKPDGYFERCMTEQAAGKRQLFIAKRDGQDCGYGLLNWQPLYALYKRLEIPEIQDLNVIPAARRGGVASAMIAHCEALARQKGCAQIGISFGLHADYGAAQRLYIKLGYMPDGFGVTYDRQAVMPGEIRPIDDNLALMMIKDLT